MFFALTDDATVPNNWKSKISTRVTREIENTEENEGEQGVTSKKEKIKGGKKIGKENEVKQREQQRRSCSAPKPA